MKTPSRNSGIIRPSLKLLSPDQINDVHQYSIRILEETGIKVESKLALEIFGKSDAVRIDNDVVFLQQELIDHSIQVAPSNIEIFKKNGGHAFHLGKKQGHETWFGIGVTNTWFQNIEKGEVELFTRKHMQHSTKLGDLLGNYDMVSTLGIPSDVKPEDIDLFSALDMYANTDKPLILLISGQNKINAVLDLLSFLRGDLSEKPFCIPYVNPITPLVLNRETSDKMIASIQHNLPLIYSNYGMYGGSSPITEGGTLALLNAELLAGLVFTQLIREGSKIILGSLPAAFNMSSMGSRYTPSSYLINLACAEMMEYYQIPHCGTSGSTSGRGADLLASENFCVNHLSSCLGKIGCVPFVGSNFDSVAFSPATVVLSDHIIGKARNFAAGFTLSDETVNLQEIQNVGHGGNFFTSEQTLAMMAELSTGHDIFQSLSLEAWKEQQMPSAEDELLETTRNLYAKAKKGSEDALDLINKGEAFISN
jgi:trimethylamine--corrinoid protein Co-methyltransferase